jgi:hypothetical protein
MARSPIPWSVPVRLDDGSEQERHIVLEAAADVREALTRSLGLQGLSHLTAEFDITPQGREWHVTGLVSANVEQICVVTLEPMTSLVREPVDATYSLDAMPLSEDERPVRGHLADSPDPPEPLVDGTADLGVLATEFLALGINPYPRKPDAVFEAPEAADPGQHPFASLASLKRPPGTQD